MAWINTITKNEYSTEDEARDSVYELIYDSDLADAIGACDVDLLDIIKELKRLESPLYYELFEYTFEALCEDYVSEIDEEE